MASTSESIRRQYLANRHREVQSLLKNDSGIGVPLSAMPVVGGGFFSDQNDSTQDRGKPLAGRQRSNAASSTEANDNRLIAAAFPHHSEPRNRIPPSHEDQHVSAHARQRESQPPQDLANLRQRIAKFKTDNAPGARSADVSLSSISAMTANVSASASASRRNSLSASGYNSAMEPPPPPPPLPTSRAPLRLSGPSSDALLRSSTPMRSPESTRPVIGRHGSPNRPALPEPRTGAETAPAPLDATAAFFSMSPSPTRHPQQGEGPLYSQGAGDMLSLSASLSASLMHISPLKDSTIKRAGPHVGMDMENEGAGGVGFNDRLSPRKTGTPSPVKARSGIVQAQISPQGDDRARDADAMLAMHPMHTSPAETAGAPAAPLQPSQSPPPPPTSDALKAFFAEMDLLDSRLDSARSISLSRLETRPTAATGKELRDPIKRSEGEVGAGVLLGARGGQAAAAALMGAPAPSTAGAVGMHRILAGLDDEEGESGQEEQARESGVAAYASIRAKVLAMSLELEDKGRAIGILRSQLGVAKQLLKAREEAADVRIKDLLSSQKREYEDALARQLAFVDTLLQDKKVLAAKMAQSAADAAEAAAAAERRVRAAEGHFAVEMARVKDAAAAGEASRRAEWQVKVEKELKVRTLKGLEPQIQALLDRHKEEVSSIRAACEESIAEAGRAGEERTARAVKAGEERGHAEAERVFESDRAAWRVKERSLRDEVEALSSSARGQYAQILEEERQRATAAARADGDRHREELSRLQAIWQSKLSDALSRHAVEREASLRGIADAVEAERARCHAERDGERAAWEARAVERMRKEMDVREADVRADASRSRDEAVRLVIGRLEGELAEEKRKVREVCDAQVARAGADGEARCSELGREVAGLRGAYEEACKARDSALNVHGDETVRLARAVEAGQEEVVRLRQAVEVARTEAEVARREALEGRQAASSALASMRARVQGLEGEVAQAQAAGEQAGAAARASADRELREVQARVAAALRKRDAELAELRVSLAEETSRADTAQRLMVQARQDLTGFGLAEDMAEAMTLQAQAQTASSRPAAASAGRPGPGTVKRGATGSRGGPSIR